MFQMPYLHNLSITFRICRKVALPQINMQFAITELDQLNTQYVIIKVVRAFHVQEDMFACGLQWNPTSKIALFHHQLAWDLRCNSGCSLYWTHKRAGESQP